MACTRREETAENRGAVVILKDRRQHVTAGVGGSSHLGGGGPAFDHRFPQIINPAPRKLSSFPTTSAAPQVRPQAWHTDPAGLNPSSATFGRVTSGKLLHLSELVSSALK